MTAAGRTVSVSVDRSPADGYAYAADPRTLPARSSVESVAPGGGGRTAGADVDADVATVPADLTRLERILEG